MEGTAQTPLTEEKFSETMTGLFSYLQENMATKDDLRNGLNSLRDELRAEMQAGFREVHDELEDIKQALARLEKKTQEDDDAVVQEVETLKKRVALLEKTILTLQKKQVIA